MLGKFNALCALAATTYAAATDNHWAVIVAGSSGYGNYRHQADTCHAYQLLKSRGIPEDQIIHMNYDDVAHNLRNPFKGKIFNHPTKKGTPGRDVYEGCKIDYRRKDVTPNNLIDVLTGNDASGVGPVLKSDENSQIFFYFADHGAPGLVAMPWGGYLYADKLHEAFKTMHSKKMYKQMTVYMEACESGSMFQNILEDDLSIYAVSAANAKESSWGTYCSPDDMVDGKHIRSCLGDLFSTNWLENADHANMVMETLQSQYNTVQKETTKSHVLQWGELSFVNETISEFEASIPMEKKFHHKKEKKHSFWHNLKNAAKDILQDVFVDQKDIDRKNEFAVDSRDIQLHYLYNLVISEPSRENSEALQKEITHRMEVDSRFETLFPQHVEAVKSNTTPLPTDFECYRKLVDTYENSCEKMDEYSLKHMKYFVAECEGMKSVPEASAKTAERIQNHCGPTKE